MRKPGKLAAATAASAATAVPPWLAEVVRPEPAPVPWPAVVRAALAVCGPLALGYALGSQAAGLLGAMGGLLGTVVDRGGPYPARIRRMATAAVFGGAAGLLLGGMVHGQGWVAVAVLVLVAGISALMSAVGATAAITGLQLLVYTILGTGPPGPLLLIPVAVFAGLLPYGRDRNWGLFSTFLTPLVVILIDLLHRTGWPLALDRLIDTALGCAIVLLVGYAPWPSSWHAHLPEQLAIALDSVARYTQQALPGQPERSALRRQSYRALSDLRTEFQRTMAEPPSVSRRAARLWPAVAALEQVTDTVTATAVRGDVTGQRPAPRDVEQLAAAVRDMARGVRDGQLPADLPLPRSDDVRELADCVADLRRAASGEQAA